MKKVALLSVLLLPLCSASGCAKDDSIITTRAETMGTNITLVFDKGEHYVHPLKINWLITIKTTPQIAVWIEDLDGHYIDTLYVTKKSGTQGWRGSPDLPAEKIRRPESLPCWSHSRGLVYPDGLFMPTRENPVTDTITAASPAGDFHLKSKAPHDLTKFVVLAEVNNSADFNDSFSKDALPGTPGYSGGEWGSGQPSIIYAATVDLTAGPATYELVPIGHGSPDGRDGGITPDLSELTTAKEIMRRITFTTQ